MKAQFVLLLTAAVLLASCGTKSPGTMLVKGKLTNGAGEQVYLQTFDANDPADSAMVASDGSFQIEIDNPPMDFFKFGLVGKKESVVLVFDSTHQNIQISSDANDFIESYQVSGSKDSELLRDFFWMVQDFQGEMDSIGRLAQNLPSDADPMIKMALGQQQMKRQTDFEQNLKNFAMKNASSPAALSIISSVPIQNGLEEYKTISRELEQVIPNSKYLIRMKDNINQFELQLAQQKKQEAMAAAIQKGKAAPEIDLQSPEGKFVSLSSLKGKYVLIDFWASWCGPCRRENPNVVKLYEKYGGKNFEILGVSLDSSKDRWEKAIAQDGLNWLHVSDLKKWNSAAAADYGVRSIPFTVLVDPEGNIVETKLRGKQLEKKLEEIFG